MQSLGATWPTESESWVGVGPGTCVLTNRPGGSMFSLVRTTHMADLIEPSQWLSFTDEEIEEQLFPWKVAE